MFGGGRKATVTRSCRLVSSLALLSCFLVCVAEMGGKKSKEPNDDPKATDGKGGKSGKPKGKKQKVLQVLVAGAAQSGKSTFFKQLQLIHFNGFSDEHAPPHIPSAFLAAQASHLS